jgi:hypothetical protein
MMLPSGAIDGVASWCSLVSCGRGVALARSAETWYHRRALNTIDCRRASTLVIDDRAAIGQPRRRDLTDLRDHRFVRSRIGVDANTTHARSGEMDAYRARSDARADQAAIAARRSRRA